MEWISVKDRLPEDGVKENPKVKQVKVLAAIKAKNGYTVRSQMRMRTNPWRESIGETDWTWKYSAGEVTHWMPLPEPPEVK